MDLELIELQSKSNEDLETLIGQLVSSDSYIGDPNLGKMPEKNINVPTKGVRNMGQMSQPSIGVSLKILNQPQKFGIGDIKEIGRSYFSMNKTKIKKVVCNNKTIKERVLKEEKPDLNWLIEKLYEELDKEFKFSSLAKVLAVYIGKIGIRKLCDS